MNLLGLSSQTENRREEQGKNQVYGEKQREKVRRARYSNS
jgi:hypothetical protein